MKKIIIKTIVSFFIAVILTIIIYWPPYQRINLNDPTSEMGVEEIKRLNLPVGKELRDVIVNNFPIPLNRHQLCLKNNNSVYLIHVDSYDSGFLFKTNDISKREDIIETEIGAMAIEIYYQDELEKDSIYRKIGQPIACVPLKIEKIEYYASSTVFYHFIQLSRTDEFNLENLSTLQITRNVADYHIDTSKSSVIIIPKHYWFLFTLVVIVCGIYKIIPMLERLGKRIWRSIKKTFTKHYENEKT